MDYAAQVDLLHKAMDALRDVSLELSPAEISSIAIHSVSQELKMSDPFKNIKEEHTRIALTIYPHFEQMVKNDPNPLAASIKFAASANLIDLGTREDVELIEEMKKEAGRELKKNDLDLFEERLGSSSSLLWITDNAGESVFDRLVLEQLKGHEIWIGVKGGAVLNDVTYEDAIASGLDRVGKLITTGSNWLGVIESRCSREFLELLDGVDVVVAKGHANFETLDTYGREIFFLLKAKCEIVAEALGVKLGDTVFRGQA